MPHDVSLIATIAVGLGLALVLGYIAHRFRVSPIVGYLVAGILVGPASPWFVADMELASQLADIGVMLMMFGVGLHFSLAELLAVRRIAIPGALVGIATATTLGVLVATSWGWHAGAAIVFALALSIASTVVLLRSLESRGLLRSPNGHIALGWLVVEDLVVILALVVLPAVAVAGGFGTYAAETSAAQQGGRPVWLALLLTVGKVGAFVLIMLVLGRRLLPWILWLVARTGSRELFTLAVISAAVGVAFFSAQLFSVSFALGAFFAGTLMRESALSHRAAEESLPLRDAFSVLFFVSVGMLFDPQILVQEPLKLLAVLAIIMLGKTVAACSVALILRYPVNTALTVGAGLAQIGEFSFVLGGLGVSLGVMPREGLSLLLAASLISISLNSLVFSGIEPLQRWVRKRSSFARLLERSDDPLAELPASFDQAALTGHVLIAGYGSVGRRVAEALAAQGVPYVVAEQNRETVEDLRGRNIPAVSGDVVEPGVLIQAHVARASVLVIAGPDISRVKRMVETARTLNPRIQVIVRATTEAEAALIVRERLGTPFLAEDEIAGAIVRQASGTVTARRNERLPAAQVPVS